MRVAPRLAVLSALISVALLAVSSSLAGTLVVAPNDPAPDTRGRFVDGTYHVIDWSASKLTVLNFWATWCEPCRAEMGELQSLFDARSTDGLSVYGVAKDTKLAPELIAAAVARLGVRYPILVDGRKISARWGGTSIIPTTYIVGTDGKVVRRYVGGSEEQVEAMLRDINDYLDGKPLQPPVIVKPRDANSTS